MYVLRTIEDFLLRASARFPVVVVTGARQVGKTTTLRRIAEPQRTYVTLDDPLVLDLARRDPALFFQRFRPPLLVDEIQYAPQLLPYIKMLVDAERRPGMLWLTGSQQFHVMKGMSESLAGRVAIVRMLGLSLREAMGLGDQDRPFVPDMGGILARQAQVPSVSLSDLYRRIWLGSLPAIALDDSPERDAFFGSYVQTYLQRDLRDLARVGDELAFLRFVRACAARTAQLLNAAELARDSDVAPNTAKAWLSILEASGIVFLLESYHSNLTKRLVKAPKLHFVDTGLCAYLTGWTTPESLEAGAMSGPILETWVVGELLKTWWHNGPNPPVWHVRDRGGLEVDVVIVHDGTIYPLEIKKTASPRVSDVGAFRRLSALGARVGPGGIVCLSPNVLPLTEMACAIPVGAL
ncbi:MAG: ATP-binding protein [Chthonomonadales bacterium]|nr:ATP-binding protein [Chthonomonadales bacterium]